MKLITKEIQKRLPVLGSTENDKDPMVQVKLFGGSGCTWLITEYDPDSRVAFGHCDLGDHDNAELGYISLDELESLKFPPFDLGVERDVYFTPTPLSEILDPKEKTVTSLLHEKIQNAKEQLDKGVDDVQR